MKNELHENLDKLHTTELGIERIKRNLNLDSPEETDNNVNFTARYALSKQLF